MTGGQYKCLIYVCGHQATKEADVRTRVLSRIEQNLEVTLQEATNECQRLMNLKHDAAMIQQSTTQNNQDIICRVSQSPQKEFIHVSSARAKPPSACWFCREWHFVRNCPFRYHVCNRYGKRGHKDLCCLSERPTMSGKPRRTLMSSLCHNETKTVTATFKVDGTSRRKFTNLTINGKEVKLQLDTASDITLICRETWCMLGRPPFVYTDYTARNASAGILKLLGELH